MARKKKRRLTRLKTILARDSSAADKAVAITELAHKLPPKAIAVMDAALDRADPLVQIAMMDAYFEITTSKRHEQDLIRILDSAQARGDGGEELYMAARLALGRVNRRSKDKLDQWGDAGFEIKASASVARRSAKAVSRPKRSKRARRGAPKARPQERITIIIHGTWASDGDWWRPGGDFFDYLKKDLDRPDLYDQKDLFTWSGKNRDSSRRNASLSLDKWLKSHPAAEVNVFAHSHGANVAMLATHHDVKIDRLIMLSPPVRKDYFAKWRNVVTAFNIQAKVDPVVAIARGGKRFGLRQVTEKTLRAKGHSSTHDPAVWRDERLDRFIGMPWPV